MKWYFWVLAVFALIAVIVIIFTQWMKSLGVYDQRLMIKTMSKIGRRFDRWDPDEYAKLSKAEITVYAAASYNIEYINGGLCQYFFNSSRYTAPYAADALAEVGATKTASAYKQFVAENEIDLYNLNEFMTDTHEEYMALYDKYPIEEFDNKAYETYHSEENLDTLIAEYIREHIDELD